MTFLPIVARELRMAARRKNTFSLRFKSAVAAALLGGVMLLVFSQIPLVPWVGPAVFEVLAGIFSLQCLYLAVNIADSVSEEKREGTLGLLFLTDLRGYDIILGKLCANSLQSFYAVMGVFPVFAIVLTLGGVSLGQFCKTALALLNVFFFAHAAGLLASVLSRVRVIAQVAAVVLIYVVLGLPLLLVGILLSNGSFLPPVLPVAPMSPAQVLVQIWIAIVGQFYWFFMVFVHLTGWLLLALASWRIPNCWQENAGPVYLRWRDCYRKWIYGSPAIREELRRRLIDINPFLWMISRYRLASAVNRVVLVLTFCFLFWVFATAESGDRMAYLIMFAVFGHWAVAAGITAAAGGHLKTHRRSGALEFFLCATPLQPKDIMAALWQSVRRQCLWVLTFVLIVDVTAVVLNHTGFTEYGSREEQLEFDCFMGAAIIMLLAHAVASGWVGMWRAMAEKQTNYFVESFFLLIVLPVAAFATSFAILSLFAHWLPNWLPESFWFSLGFGFFLMLTTAVGLTFLARRLLRMHFREMAVVQVAEPREVLSQLGRWLGLVWRGRLSKPSS